MTVGNCHRTLRIPHVIRRWVLNNGTSNKKAHTCWAGSTGQTLDHCWPKIGAGRKRQKLECSCRSDRQLHSSFSISNEVNLPIHPPRGQLICPTMIRPTYLSINNEINLPVHQRQSQLTWPSMTMSIINEVNLPVHQQWGQLTINN